MGNREWAIGSPKTFMSFWIALFPRFLNFLSMYKNQISNANHFGKFGVIETK